MEFLRDLWLFIEEHKKFWLGPIIIILLLLGVLIVLGAAARFARNIVHRAFECRRTVRVTAHSTAHSECSFLCQISVRRNSRKEITVENTLKAERQGFEPWIPQAVYRFSRPAPSTTRPPLQGLINISKTGLFCNARLREPHSTEHVSAVRGGWTLSILVP